jgi:hypothetical protein
MRIQGLWESRSCGEPVWRVMPFSFWHIVENAYTVIDEPRRFSWRTLSECASAQSINCRMLNNHNLLVNLLKYTGLRYKSPA